MLLAFSGQRDIAVCCMAQPAIEVGFRRLKKGRCCPEQPLRVQRRVKSRRIVPGEEACLQLSYPVPARSDRRHTLQSALKLELIETRVVEAAESRRGAA